MGKETWSGEVSPNRAKSVPTTDRLQLVNLPSLEVASARRMQKRHAHSSRNPKHEHHEATSQSFPPLCMELLRKPCHHSR